MDCYQKTYISVGIGFAKKEKNSVNDASIQKQES